MSRLARPRTMAALLLTGLAATAAVGCGSDDGSSSTSTPAASTPSASTSAGAPVASGDVKSGALTIAYKDFAIEPEKVTVKVGTKLTWTNADTTAHNVITKPGAPEEYTSKDFDKGQTVTFTPTKPGVYNYLCTFHPATMQGVITVVK